MILDLPKLGQVEFDDNLTPPSFKGKLRRLLVHTTLRHRALKLRLVHSPAFLVVA